MISLNVDLSRSTAEAGSSLKSSSIWVSSDDAAIISLLLVTVPEKAVVNRVCQEDSLSSKC